MKCTCQAEDDARVNAELLQNRLGTLTFNRAQALNAADKRMNTKILQVIRAWEKESEDTKWCAQSLPASLHLHHVPSQFDIYPCSYAVMK